MGFKAEGPLHRLWWGGQRLDLVPFDGVERPDRRIGWPPDEDTVMDASGLTEALAAAIAVRLPGGATFDVASLPAQALLKTWAWKDRRYLSPGKDASDLWTILRHYAQAGNEERIYSQEGEALRSFGFDMERAGAWLLGRDGRDVLARGSDPTRTLEALDAILRPETDPEGLLRLVSDMPPGDRERQLLLIEAFAGGLFGGEPRDASSASRSVVRR